MKDFPVFATEYGAASLTLRQVPYRREAYIHLQDFYEENRSKLIEECASFCRIAGAEKIYVTPPAGEPTVRILKMRGVPILEEEKIENIFPVTEETVGAWREIANERMKHVDLAGWLQKADEENILNSGGAYFIHRSGSLLGIGWLQENQLKLLAATVPGEGYHVAQTLLSVCPGISISLEVASTNLRAIHLYERLGFLAVEELEAWEQV